MSTSRLKPGFEWSDVLVMVKTYPAPSQTHGETVCVAGVRLDGPSAPSWIRLYPISFRALELSDKFKKYQRIKIPVRTRGSYDPRPESYEPDVNLMQLGQFYKSDGKGWSARRELISPLLGQTTTCDLIELNRNGSMDQSVQSLGLVRATIEDVKLEPGKPWSGRQLAKVRAFSQDDLFGNGRAELQPVPFQIKIKYQCGSKRCHGHDEHLIDWELGAMGLKWPAKYKERTGEMILDKYKKTLDNSVNDVYLIIGNQHQRRHIFSVCGIWSPKL